MKTSELLRKAADEIRRRGWHQGDYGDNLSEPESCRVCTLGAINVVTTGDPSNYMRNFLESRGATHALEMVTGETLLHEWNDAEDRTVEEVLDAFERAAAVAEENDD